MGNIEYKLLEVHD